MTNAAMSLTPDQAAALAAYHAADTPAEWDEARTRLLEDGIDPQEATTAAYCADLDVPVISAARLARNTSDSMALTATERANVAAALAGSLAASALSKRELRGVAQSHRAAMMDAGLHAAQSP